MAQQLFDIAPACYAHAVTIMHRFKNACKTDIVVVEGVLLASREHALRTSSFFLLSVLDFSSSSFIF
jgi:pantothenate kinase